MGKLSNKVAIVVGGNEGIGDGTTHRFAEEGAKVAILARRALEGRKVEQSIRSSGGEATYIPCDVTDNKLVSQAVMETISCYGAINILFYGAGTGAPNMFPYEDLQEWEEVFKVNLTGCFLMCKAVWPYLIGAGGGAIINVSSLAAQSAPTDTQLEQVSFLPSASYYASKAGVEAFTRYIAGIGARHNIRANCLRPGQILTEAVTSPEGKHVFTNFLEPAQMLKGPGYPLDVANAAVFLASDDSRFITAETINVDGGLVAKV
ncbi:SDR family NAD(P)-dependent oxidoreductase [Microbulbifer sp. VAAC004]|uniref:SDR family NAD(P)-dependent oxidoreductase n=1 Tax=unclassified Microbulbifer TaxID=2619833 RepID=UPI00403A374F